MTHGVPLLRGTNVLPGRLDLRDMRFISPATHRLWSKSALRPGDLVIVRVGYPGTCAVIPSGLGEANAASLVIVRPNAAKLNSHYASQVINSPVGRNRILTQLVGGAQQVFNTTLAAKFEIAVPPRAEQDRIAEALDDADALIADLDRLIAKKQAIKQGMMQQLLTGNMRLPGFKDPWHVVALGDLGKTYGGLSGKSADDFGSGNAKFITFMNVMSNVRIDLTELAPVRVSHSEKQNAVAAGDVLFNGSSESSEELALASVAESAPPMTYLNSFCFGFRPRSREAVDSLFLAYLFRGGPGRGLMQALAQGSTRYNMSKAQFRRLSIQMPPLDEQVAIAQCLVDADDELVALRLRLTKAKAIKQGMVQELLTGRTRLPVKETAS